MKIPPILGVQNWGYISLCYELRGAYVISEKVYSAMMLLPVISAGTGRPI